MARYTEGIKWGRVAAAGAGALVADDLLFTLIPFLGWLTGPFTPWITPALAGLFAVLVARSVPSRDAVKHGVAVGMIASLIPALTGFPSPPALVYAAATVSAGALGGKFGGNTRAELPMAREPADENDRT